MYLYIDMFCCLRVERHETVDQCYRNDRTSCPGRCFEAAAFEVLYLIALSGSCSFREDQKFLPFFTSLLTFTITCSD